MALRAFIDKGVIAGELEALEFGNSIFRQGEAVTCFYLITKGRVALIDHTTGISEQLVAPPDFLLGATDLLHATYSFTAYTLEHTELIRIKKDAIQEAVNKDPLLRLYLLKMMSWEASLTKMAFE
ncbi:Crp/Fnr family transcriptional regulator [Pontibacter indicus]|uniref:Cyclic nucleotide-binding domain-containing protein n=1 Tax=Pontibacter indicus TaxID=1317125 RepID=A0A1R3WQ20_9BACT|nr:cyclic nucleotide-binding domain-containing protein [Pontibacter indicus]SIT79991.1 Cyclic nucleotide-binding domain-containing protein [Pontibacter indicus]